MTLSPGSAAGPSPNDHAPVLVSVGDPVGDKADTYVEALKVAGVPAERIRVVMPEGIRGDAAPGVDYASLAASAAGLVLAGGDDVEPRHYGHEPIPEANLVLQPERDLMELALLAGAREARVPVWGVCRGLQILDVFFGGTLWQDLALQLPTQVLHQLSNPMDALIHPVTARVGVRNDRATAAHHLVEILEREPPLVNSRHHQGVRDLAPQLAAVGHAPDGLVEALVLPEPDWWLAAVQWHPENLIGLALQRALWEEFARAAGFGGEAPSRAPIPTARLAGGPATPRPAG